MTEEEFRKLPSCIRYKNPGKDCSKLNDDDWDELEDCCERCLGFKYFYIKYYSGAMNESYEEILSKME